MNDQTLDRAITEAARFIVQAKRLRAARKRDRDVGLPLRHPVESGAARRASMDLTRALADLRQGR